MQCAGTEKVKNTFVIMLISVQPWVNNLIAELLFIASVLLIPPNVDIQSF